MTQPVLSVRNLEVEFVTRRATLRAINGVSFDIAKGEVLGVVGESGAGKSVTGLAVIGLIDPPGRICGGEIELSGTRIDHLPPEEIRRVRGKRIGMIFQDPLTSLNPLYRIGDQIIETIRTHTNLSESAARRRAIDLLAEVGIPAPEKRIDGYPHEFSGGMRQRVVIALAICAEPELIIADEPTTALDVTTQAQILKLIRDLQQRKKTAVLFITHDFGVVAEIADRVVVMQHGAIVEQGTADKVLNDPQHAYTRQLIAAVPPLKAPPPRILSGKDILTIDGVSKTYRTGGFLGRGARVTEAVKNVSLHLPRGATLGIVGESGSGKSTLARCIVRLIDPDSGSIVLDGKDWAKLGREDIRRETRHIQMVFQDPFASLNPRRKAAELVAQGPIVHGTDRATAIAEARKLFELVGLDPSAGDRFPHEFSGGQRQRIGLARALALKPDVLVADEPVSALDVSVQAQVLKLLAGLRQQLGLSIIFITHDLRVAAQICDLVAVMKDGAVVEQGLSAEVFGKPQHPYTQALLAAIPGGAFAREHDIATV